MAAVVETSPDRHSPPPPTAKRPRGILKNSYQGSPPQSPTKEEEVDLTAKEITIHNTQVNAGHRRSSSTTSRPAGSRRQSTKEGPHDPNHPDASQRLQWDEANLYLTEQERTPKMKIDEPKTPYAKHYDPSEDPDEDDYMTGTDGGHGEIPGLSLGEPEEEVPLDEFAKKENGLVDKKGDKAVHVSDDGSGPHDAELDGLSAEELEKHYKFEKARKKHYEMKNVAELLAHPEDLDDLEDEDGGDVPALPANGRAV